MSIISRIKNRLTKPVNYEQQSYNFTMKELNAGDWSVADIQLVVERLDAILESRSGFSEINDDEIAQRRDGMLRAVSVFLAKGMAA